MPRDSKSSRRRAIILPIPVRVQYVWLLWVSTERVINHLVYHAPALNRGTCYCCCTRPTCLFDIQTDRKYDCGISSARIKRQGWCHHGDSLVTQSAVDVPGALNGRSWSIAYDLQKFLYWSDFNGLAHPWLLLAAGQLVLSIDSHLQRKWAWMGELF